MKSRVRVPKLRFHGFQGDWEEMLLGELTSKPISYGIVQTGANQENGIPCVRVVDLTKADIDPSDMIKTTKSISDSYSRTLLSEGDIMFPLRGEIGFVRKVTQKLIGANLTRGIANISPNDSVVVSDYLFHSIKSPLVINSISNKVNGSALQEIPLNQLRQVLIPIPSLPEQQKIADFLSAVDRKIEQLVRKKALLEDYKKGVMQKIFSQKLRFKDENGKGYPKWEEKKLGDVAEFFKGKGIGKDNVDPDGSVECIRYGELYTSYTECIGEVFSRTKISDDLYFGKKNDVIIPASGETSIDIARAAYLSRDGIALGGDINIIRTNEYGLFLAYYLNNAKKMDIAKMAQGNAVVHLYARQLSHLEISLPSLPEQQRLANFFSALDAKIEKVAAQIERSREFKKGLLQQMFV